ncbi:MAG: AAA-like domain-containing protein, partial [Anaerolineales bacterium]|nr:AAA-like domain-containing protein [Anaerolineales bacterium]
LAVVCRRKIRYDPGMDVEMLSADQWHKAVRQALKAWHRPVTLGRSQLATDRLIQQKLASADLPDDIRGRGLALQMILREAIQALAPAADVPSEAADLRWLELAWRPYALLTLLYPRDLPKHEVQARVGLAEGGQYYQALREAIAMLAQLLQDWEGQPRQAQPIAPLSFPSGALLPDDPFYVRRACDAQLAQELGFPGRTVTISGPRQVGKTSLLIRGIQQLRRDPAYEIVYVDVQSAGQEQLVSLDSFLYFLLSLICDELDYDQAELDAAWQGGSSPSRKATRFLEKGPLQQDGVLLALALDEVDRLLPCDFATDFFGLLRSWHNRRSVHATWQRFTLLMAISTEPYVLISDLNQSPFNVGLNLVLTDFDEAQITDLHNRYGAPLAASELAQLSDWLHGHPFLTRSALYELVTRQLSLTELQAGALAPHSPFAPHLHHLGRLISADPDLAAAVAEQLGRQSINSLELRYRLQMTGLIQDQSWRCDLYRDYLAREFS